MNGRQLLKNFEESSERVARLAREVDYMESRNMWQKSTEDSYKEACHQKDLDKVALLTYIRGLENRA